jgi:hypothetical protein
MDLLMGEVHNVYLANRTRPMKVGSRVTIKTTCSDYYGLTGVMVKEYPSKDPANFRYNVAFDQTELRKSPRPDRVLKAKSYTIYFMVNELEPVNVAT